MKTLAFALTVIAVHVIFAQELVPPSPGIECFDNSNGTELTTECQLGEICQTKIEFEPNGYRIYKQCKVAFSCYMNQIINSKQCAEGVSTRVCHYCCRESFCNTDEAAGLDGTEPK